MQTLTNDQESEVEVDQIRRIGGINAGLVLQDVERLVAVEERHTADVPEVQHPAEVLVEHVPGAGNAVLTLGGGVGVQPVREDHEGHVGGDVAEGLVLLHRAGQSEEHQGDPGPAALGDHLDVHLADAGVQDGAHEEVINHVAGAGRGAVVLVGHGQAVQVPAHSGHIGDDHRGDQALAVVVRHVGQRENTIVVRREKQHDAEVVARIAIAVIVQALAIRSGGQTLHGESRHETGQQDLHEEEKEVRHPNSLGRNALGHEEVAKASNVAFQGLNGSGNDNVATVRLQAVPAIAI